jgi:hypothetical protein
LLPFRSVVKSPSFISSYNGIQKLISLLWVARENLQRGTNPFRFVIDRYKFWAPSVPTIIFTLIFMTQLYELQSKTLRKWFDATLLSSLADLHEFLLQFSEERRQRSKIAYRSFIRREHKSSLRRIHGTTSTHFADS